MSADAASAAPDEGGLHGLAPALARLRERLRAVRSASPDERGGPSTVAGVEPSPPALEALARDLGLSPFERDLLLLCAGVELDPELAVLCAEVQGAPGRRFASFGLALAALPGAHWSALTPAAPLRRLRLVEVEDGAALSAARLRIDERILHHLAGAAYLDPRLSPLVRRRRAAHAPAAGQREVAARALDALRRGPLRPVVLTGDDREGQLDVAAAVAEGLGLALHTLRAADLPAAPAELEAFAVLWGREAVLLRGALAIECEEEPTPAALRALERLPGLVFLAARETSRGLGEAVRAEVGRPGPEEQQALWRSALGPAAARLDGALDAVATSFRLSAREIAAAGETLRAELLASDRPDALLWRHCRGTSRTRLEDLAQRIEPAARWDELVLPPAQRAQLRQLALHVSARRRVHDEWGFAARGRRGLGVAALFAGESGTGKTMAAEVLAGELDLDLYRIDLSAVVSKFIGETEKNLRRVFDAAEDGGAILLFDEADALFGRRSEVKDSHDRYANIEVSYLLQRMEAYRGLAILTTNLRAALDPAFLRRLRFVVSFPFPGAEEREAIWRGIFPAATPLAALDHARLARPSLSGGQIRSIALHAAFLAAGDGAPVGMAHLLRAAREDAAKRERPLSEAEIRGWV